MSFGRGYAGRFAGIDDHLAPSDHDPGVHERIMPTSQSRALAMGDTPSASGSALDMLSRFGINITQAAMAVPGLFFTVGASNPAAPTTMVIVKGAQNALNEIAFSTKAFPQLQVDGILGDNTISALSKTVGSDVMSRSWLNVYGVLRNKIDTIGFSGTRPASGTKPSTVTLPGDGLPVPESSFMGLGDTSTLLMVGGGVLLAALLFGGSGKSKGKSSKRKRR